MEGMTSQKKRSKRRIVEDESEEEVSQVVDTIVSQAEASQDQSRTVNNSQSTNERRLLRTGYRRLISDTSSKKQELIQPDSDGLARALELSDRLYSQVKMPREAVLDSEFLSLASQLGVEKSSRLHTGFKTFDPNELITKIRYALLKEASVDVAQEIENENIDNWNWNGLGQTASSLFLRVPSFTSLNGAIVSERPEKPKKERQKKEKDKVGTRVNPEEVDETQEDAESLDRETSRRVGVIKEHLEKAKKMNFFNFLIDPQSFGQTVENVFHFAFLIKDGQAAVTIGEDGVPLAEPSQPPHQEDYSSGRAERKQSIVRMDYASWQKLKDKYNAQGYLPHRKPGKYPSLRRQATTDLTETSASQSNSKTKKTSQRSEKGKRRKQEESEEEEEEEEEEEPEENGTDESLSEIEATLPVESPKKKRPSQTTSSQSLKKFKK